MCHANAQLENIPNTETPYHSLVAAGIYRYNEYVIFHRSFFLPPPFLPTSTHQRAKAVLAMYHTSRVCVKCVRKANSARCPTRHSRATTRTRMYCAWCSDQTYPEYVLAYQRR
jgi:hypothetical protein